MSHAEDALKAEANRLTFQVGGEFVDLAKDLASVTGLETLDALELLTEDTKTALIRFLEAIALSEPGYYLALLMEARRLLMLDLEK